LSFKTSPSKNDANDSENDYAKFSKKSASKLSIERSRTPTSIPLIDRSAHQNIKKYPQLNLELRLPQYPEKYLLPIRFPILYQNIISNLVKFTQSARRVE